MANQSHILPRERGSQRDESNQRLTQVAYNRLSELVQEAEVDGFYGVTAVEITCANGTIQAVRRRSERVDK